MMASASSTLAIVGLGKIAEFSNTAPPKVSLTSDRQELLAYASNQEATTTTTTTTEKFAIHFARAAVLSPNCIAVSWGFNDGIVVLYRRIKVSNLDYGWQAVWMLGPSQPVLDNMAANDLFHDDIDSPLLKVSDCLPLHVETGEEYDYQSLGRIG